MVLATHGYLRTAHLVLGLPISDLDFSQQNYAYGIRIKMGEERRPGDLTPFQLTAS
jgi:hypothetical protein